MPNSCVQATSAAGGMTGRGSPGATAAATSSACAASCPGSASSPGTGPARRRPGARRPGCRPRPPPTRSGAGGGLLRGVVARHRGAVDERVLVRVASAQPRIGVAARPPPVSGAARPSLRPPRRPPRPRRQRVVGVDDEGRQQVVPAREVPVQGRRDHAQLAGDGAQRQPLRARRGQLPPRLVLDLAGDLGPRPLPGRRPDAPGCVRCHVHRLLPAVCHFREHRSNKRALLLTMRQPFGEH